MKSAIKMMLYGSRGFPKAEMQKLIAHLPLAGQFWEGRRIQLVATKGADEEDAAGALLKYEIQEGAVGMKLGFVI